MNQPAHEALLSHGWRHLGQTTLHELRSPVVHAYAHPGFEGQHINVASAGQWEHTNAANVNMPAAGRTARQLVRYLSVIHGTASIADLHLPGRKDVDE